MAENDEGTGWKSSSRGEAAWKETRDQIASRNADARAKGKRERESYEQNREEARRAMEAKQYARLLGRKR